MMLKGLFAIELNMGFDQFEKYLSITEKYLQRAKEDFNIWFNKESKNLSLEDRNEFNESYVEAHWDYAEEFPRILRSSFFVSVYSLLENKMALICERLKKEKQIPISWNDLKGDTLDQFKRYCKLASLDLSYNSESWKDIQHYSMLRNCIVHNRGLIQGSRHERELKFYTNSKNIVEDIFSGISTRSQPQITLTEEFCKEVIKTMWDFLNSVLKAYELQRQ